jgi:hypothetical protein
MTDMTQVRADEPSGGEKVKEAAATLAQEAGGEVKAVGQDARAHGQQLIATSMESLRSQAGEQTTRLSDGLSDASQQLRRMANGDPQPGMVGDLVHQLADVTQRAADRLSSGGLDGAMNDLRRVARNQTGLFLLGALGAGIVAGRVIRATDTKSIAQTAKEALSSSGDGGTGSQPAGLSSSGSTPSGSMPSAMPPPLAVGSVGSAGLGAGATIAEFE